MRLDRPQEQRDMVLFLPDQLLVIGYDAAAARLIKYEFSYKGQTTLGSSRTGEAVPFGNPSLLF
jgi:anthranilate synthase